MYITVRYTRDSHGIIDSRRHHQQQMEQTCDFRPRCLDGPECGESNVCLDVSIHWQTVQLAVLMWHHRSRVQLEGGRAILGRHLATLNHLCSGQRLHHGRVNDHTARGHDGRRQEVVDSSQCRPVNIQVDIRKVVSIENNFKQKQQTTVCCLIIITSYDKFNIRRNKWPDYCIDRIGP